MDLSSRSVRKFTPHEGLASCVAWRSYLDPLNDNFLTGGADCKVRMHSALTGKVVNEYSAEPKKGAFPIINPPFVHALDVTVEGMTLAVGAGDGVLRVYDLMNQKLVRAFHKNKHKRGITCVAFPSVCFYLFFLYTPVCKCVCVCLSECLCVTVTVTCICVRERECVYAACECLCLDSWNCLFVFVCVRNRENAYVRVRPSFLLIKSRVCLCLYHAHVCFHACTCAVTFLFFE